MLTAPRNIGLIEGTALPHQTDGLFALSASIHGRDECANIRRFKDRWDVSQHVTLGRKSLNGSSGGGILEADSESQQWEDLADAAKEAIAGPAETSFEINARIAAGKNT